MRELKRQAASPFVFASDVVVRSPRRALPSCSRGIVFMKIRFAGLSRRQVVRGAACAVLLGLVACVGGTTNAGIFTMPWEQPRGPNPAFARHVVAYPTHERPGTIIVDPGSHFLYFVHDAGQAIRYGVGVGAEGFV